MIDLALDAYNKKGAKMINYCRLHLQVISIADILTYDLKHIHTSYRVCERPPSRQSHLFWPDFPPPPKHFKKLWSRFIHTIVTSYITKKPLTWMKPALPRYKNIFFRHHADFHMYKIVESKVTRFPLASRQRASLHTQYLNIPYQSDIDPNDN